MAVDPFQTCTGGGGSSSGICLGGDVAPHGDLFLGPLRPPPWFFPLVNPSALVIAIICVDLCWVDLNQFSSCVPGAGRARTPARRRRGGSWLAGALKQVSGFHLWQLWLKACGSIFNLEGGLAFIAGGALLKRRWVCPWRAPEPTRAPHETQASSSSFGEAEEDQ